MKYTLDIPTILKEGLASTTVEKVKQLRVKLPGVYSETYRSREDAKIREENLKYYGKALGQLKRRIKKSMLKDKLIFQTRKVRG